VAEVAGDLTRINGLGFTVDDPEPYYDEAREAAIISAVAKAEQMASVADVALGAPTYIGETGSSVPPIPYAARDYGFAGESLDAVTPISAGETEIVVTVQMGFALQ
jgi:uncharacterized protein YggE